MPEFVLKGEKANGRIFQIERGFTSQEDAEDYPVRLAEWKRVWAEPLAAKETREQAPERAPPISRTFRIEHAFHEILAAALAGERCPINDIGHVSSMTTMALCKAGRIRVDVYAKNWRVVTITAGEHAGKKTAMPNFKHGPAYVTVTKEGRHTRATWR